uniref:Pellino FHA domain-containing protein n=1 Tax=Spermophilus dauricus TaxID=99837 RepID=A0A8C9PSK6_SPEDA
MVLEGNPEVGTPRTSDLQHPGNKGSCILSSSEDAQPGEEPIKYGELIVLGYNGCLASGDKGRRRSRLALSRRPHANGVKPDVMHHISTPLVSKASSLSQHPVPGPGLGLPTAPVEQGSALCCHSQPSGYQRNDDGGKSFVVCTGLYSLQNVSLTTRPHSLDRKDHFRGSQGS